MRPDSTMRRFLFALVTVIGAFVLSVVCLEYWARWYFPAFDPSGQVTLEDTAEGLPLGPRSVVRRLTKNTGDYDVSVRFNRHGLRDKRDIRTAAPTDYVVVGDSFAFGWGVEEHERYSDLLESRIAAKVFNVALPGGALAAYRQQLAYARRLGADARHVIVSVCMENDLAGLNRFEDRSPVSSGARQFVSSAKIALTATSAAYRLLSYIVHSKPWLESSFVRVGGIVPNLEGIPKKVYVPQAIEAATVSLLEMVGEAAATVLIIPSRGLWVGRHRDAERRIHAHFVSSLRQRGMAVVDLRPAMEQNGPPLRYHFPNDGHWNRLGHSLAAEHLARELTVAMR